MTINNLADSERIRPLRTTVYSRESSLINPIGLFKEILSDLFKCRELIWILFTRDLRAHYRQSLLGYIWLFVPVLSTTLVWMFLSSTQVIKVSETPIPYPAYVLIGSLVWVVFLSCVNQPLASFNQGQGVFMKLKVPPEAFIFAGTSQIIFDTIVRCSVLIPVLLYLGVYFSPTFWLFPVGLLGAGLLGLSIGMLMIPLASLYSDVSRIVSTGLQFGMYLTPIVYPAPKSGWAATLINANPLTHIVSSTRDWLTLGFNSSNIIFLIVTMASLLLLFFAMLILRVVLPHLIERMGM
jgi:lipopolysaccharide transport system permease protein